MKKLNVLILTESFNCGGAETHIMTFIRNNLDKVNFAMVSRGGAYVKELEKIGVKHFLNDFYQNDKEAILNGNQRIEKIIRELSIDLVHIHPYNTFYHSVLALEKAKKPYLITFHSAMSTSNKWEDGYGDEYRFFWQKVIFENAFRIIAVSPIVQKFLIENFNCDQKKIEQIPNSIDDTFFKEEATEKLNKFIWLSRLDTDKELAIEEAIEFFAEYKKSVNSKATLTIAGVGNAKENLEKKSAKINKELGEKAVIFTGNVLEPSKLLKSHDVVFGMGRTILEGVAAKKLTILFGYDGLKGIVTPKSFFKLFEHNFNGLNVKTVKKSQVLEDLENKDLKGIFEKNFEILKDGFSSSVNDPKIIKLYEEAVRTKNQLNGQDIEMTNVFLAIKERIFNLKKSSSLLEVEKYLAEIKIKGLENEKKRLLKTKKTLEERNEELYENLYSSQNQLEIVRKSRGYQCSLLFKEWLKNPLKTPLIFVKFIRILFKKPKKLLNDNN